MFLIKSEYNGKVNKVMKKIDNSNIKVKIIEMTENLTEADY